jgi:Raf kinase inhibitor-like YbhB/YbcL family protein
MGIAHDAAAAVGKTLRSARAGTAKLTSRKLGLTNLPALIVESSSFVAEQALPTSATKEGEGTAPMITWSDAPPSTRSFVLICEDPDAPLPNPLVHWLVYGIPGTTTTIERSPTLVGREGRNSFQRDGWVAAQPPFGHGLHHYHFQVFALDVGIDLRSGAGRSAVVDAMRGHVVAWGEIVGTYVRN